MRRDPARNQLPLWMMHGPCSVASTARTTLTASASANTMGSWTSLSVSVGSKPAGAIAITVADVAVSAADSSAVVEVGYSTDGGGSYTPITTLAVGGWHIAAVYLSGGQSLILPFSLPPSALIGARMQAIVGSRTSTIGVAIFDAIPGVVYPTNLSTLGVDLATSTGVAHSASANTWVPLGTSTMPYAGVLLLSALGVSVISTATAKVELGVGASGTETVVSIQQTTTTSSELIVTNAVQIPTPGYFPTGTRFAIRCGLVGGGRQGYLIGIPHVN